MARYIDADNLIAHLKDEIKGCEIPSGGRANGKGIAYGTALGLKSAISFAETLPTADVVPKSEVQRIVGEYYDKCDECRTNCAKAVAWEIFEEMYGKVASKIDPYIRPIFKDDEDFDAGFRNGKTDALIEVLVIIAELKKKHTESEDNAE